METDQTTTANRNVHLKSKRKFDSLKLNMTKTVDIIRALADAIETDTRHIEENRSEAIVFIDEQLVAIKAAKELIQKVEKTNKAKDKNDA